MPYNWCGIRDSMLDGKLTPDDYYAWQIAHSDTIGTDEELHGYKLPLDLQKEMEAARRAAGFLPAPVYDENHVNVMPIPPKKKGDSKPSLEKQKAQELVKQRRKRKPK